MLHAGRRIADAHESPITPYPTEMNEKITTPRGSRKPMGRPSGRKATGRASSPVGVAATLMLLASPVSADCRTGTATAQLSCELALKLKSLPGKSLLNASSSPEHNATSKIATELQSELAKRLNAQPAPRMMSVDEATRERGYAQVIQLSPVLDRRGLTLRADVYPRRTVWDRVLGPAKTIASYEAFRRRDPHLRQFLTAIALTASPPVGLNIKLNGPVSLACGSAPIESTAGRLSEPTLRSELQIAVVERHQIRLFALQGKTLTRLASVPWKRLSGVRGTPFRQPLTVATLSDGLLRVGTSDRSDGLDLSSKLEVLKRYPDLLPVGAKHCAKLSFPGLVGPQPCESRALRKGQRPQDALASLQLTDDDGTVSELMVGRDSVTHVAIVAHNGRELFRLTNTGAALALGDLNGDGNAELVSSANTQLPIEDALTVSRNESGKATLVYQVPFPSGVQAIASCPTQGDRQAAILVASGGRLWRLH